MIVLHVKQINKIIKRLLIQSKRLELRRISSKLTINNHKENNLLYCYFCRNLTSRPHMAGLQEDLDSAEFIEQRWKDDGLQVNKPRYNVLLSYPDQNTPNRFE